MAPIDVIRILNRNGIGFVLVSAHGLADWRSEPRVAAECAIEIVIPSSDIGKAVSGLLIAFPTLEATRVPLMFRLCDRRTRRIIVHVIKPLMQPYSEVLKHTHRVTLNSETYRIPSPEMAIAMVFSAMTSLYRAVEDQRKDWQDFAALVGENPKLNVARLAKIVSGFSAQAGTYVLRYVRMVKAGQSVRF